MNTADGPYQRRNSLRHPHFDYTGAGAYFVTICTAQRACLFGEVAGGIMRLNPLGQIAHNTWPALISKHNHAALDAFVIMPNHIHVLLWLRPSDASAMHTSTQERAFGVRVAGSLSVLIGGYKSSVTQQAEAGQLLSATLWQRNFYDNIVRDDEALARIREYIRTNPDRWLDDKLHPAAPPNRFNRG